MNSKNPIVIETLETKNNFFFSILVKPVCFVDVAPRANQSSRNSEFRRFVAQLEDRSGRSRNWTDDVDAEVVEVALLVGVAVLR